MSVVNLTSWTVQAYKGTTDVSANWQVAADGTNPPFQSILVIFSLIIFIRYKNCDNSKFGNSIRATKSNE
jgi:hypothetical protein